MPAPAAELHARVLRCPALWIADRFGSEALEAALRAAQLGPEVVDSSDWITSEQLATFLREVRALAGDDDTFAEACTHRLHDAYGFIRYVFAALTPALVLKLAGNTLKLVSAVHRAEVVSEGRNHVRFVVRSARPDRETRLTCLSRQAQSASMPTLFGLPKAEVTEHRCMARGDDVCEYDYRFYTLSRWVFTVLGFFAGVGIGTLLSQLGWASAPMGLVAGFAGALLGALVEMRRTHVGNLAHGMALQDAMRQMADHDAEARREILALRQRERHWTSIMEEQVAERTRTLQDIVGRVRAIGAARATSLRGLSHDLRNPLSVLLANNDFLRTQATGDDLLHEMADDNESAIRKMETMLRDLVSAAQTDASLVRITPETLHIEPLVEVLRRRTRALVFGRDIRVSVFRTREAPEQIITDPLVFERVMDNLCTNAAKYTEQGSIVIELDGTPDQLVVKISDTGCGIEDDRLEAIFAARGTTPDRRSPDSLGVGLSVVVQLLEQIGGRLEVMSQKGKGATFWVYFPLRPVPPVQPLPLPGERAALSQVVTVRRLSA